MAATFLGFSAHAANVLWIGNSNANFGTFSNWTGFVDPNNDTLVFGLAGTAGANLNNNIVGATYVGFTFNAGASAYTFSGSAFTLTGNIVNSSTAAQTFGNAISLSMSGRTFSSTTGGGALTFTGNITQTGGGGSVFTTGGSPTAPTSTSAITLAGVNSFASASQNSSHLVSNGARVVITGTTTFSGNQTRNGGLALSGNSTVTVSAGGTLI